MEKITQSHEETARRHNQTPGLIFTGFCWIAFFVSALIAMIFLQGLFNLIGSGQFTIQGFLMSLLLTAVFGGIAFLFWRGEDKMRVEYDCTFTPVSGGNADLDVARVMGNSRRKPMTSLPLKNVESAGAVDAPAFQRYLQMKDVKVHNWFVNREANLYFFYFVKANVKHMIVLELKDEMISCVKPYLGMGVWQK